LLATVLFVWPGVANADRTGTAAKPASLPIINVAVIGDFYSYGYSASADAALRHSVPPTLQALNQIQAANPRVRIQVLFIPVAAAVGGGLSRAPGSGKQPGQSALIDEIRSANVVVDGLAVGNARFASTMRAVLFDARASSKTLLRLTSVFGTGAYLKAETALLGSIATRVAPGSSIVTVGYPKVMPRRLSSGSLVWWSPFTGGTVSQLQASMSDQLASALNTANDQATSITGAKYPRLHLFFTDLSAATSGSAGGTATPSAQMIIGNELLPYLDQAVNDELAARGIQGATNVGPVTPGARWYLTVLLPVTRVAHKPGRSGSPGRTGSSWSRVVGPKSRVTANSGVNTSSVRLPARTPACAFMPTARRAVRCGGAACGILCGGSGNGGGRRVVPGLGFPAPPGPLPRPVGPKQQPSAAPGQGANPGNSSGATPSRSGSGSPSGTGSTSSPSGRGTSGSGPGTTSSGPGTTSSGGGTTSGYGSTSGAGPSSGYGSTSGTGSTSGGGSYSGGGSASGGGSSGGVS
jgi:hypothetical protein